MPRIPSDISSGLFYYAVARYISSLGVPAILRLKLPGNEYYRSAPCVEVEFPAPLEGDDWVRLANYIYYSLLDEQSFAGRVIVRVRRDGRVACITLAP